MKFINFRSKSVSPLIASILLIVVSVIFVVIFLTWSQSFTNEELNKQSNLNDLEHSDVEHYIYPKTFSNGLMQFNYSPPANIGTKDIVINKYKIFCDNNETDKITLTSPYTLKQGINFLKLGLFNDQHISSKKFTVVLETDDNKSIIVKNITNPYPYDETEEEPEAVLEQVATPTAYPVAGTYTSTMFYSNYDNQVILTTSTSDANIYYTTDESIPTQANTLYSGPISIAATTTLKAKAFKTGWTDSNVFSGAYIITSGGMHQQ
jgi:hypothetical protein